MGDPKACPARLVVPYTALVFVLGMLAGAALAGLKVALKSQL